MRCPSARPRFRPEHPPSGAPVFRQFDVRTAATLEFTANRCSAPAAIARAANDDRSNSARLYGYAAVGSEPGGRVLVNVTPVSVGMSLTAKPMVAPGGDAPLMIHYRLRSTSSHSCDHGNNQLFDRRLRNIDHATHNAMRQERQAKPIRDVAWKAQERLCRRHRKLTRAGKLPTVTTAAIARELSGFIWAIAKKVQPTAT